MTAAALEWNMFWPLGARSEARSAALDGTGQPGPRSGAVDRGTPLLETHFRRAAGGDPAAFQAWVQAVTPVLYRLACRLVPSDAEAQDVVQEAVVRAWQGMDAVRQPEASLGWVCGIARRVASEFRRRAARRPTVSLDAATLQRARGVLEPWADGTASPETLVGDEQVRTVLLAMVAQLSEKHRLVLQLRDLDGLGVAETAAALGVAPGTVDSRLHRARAALGKLVRGTLTRRGQRWWS